MSEHWNLCLGVTYYNYYDGGQWAMMRITLSNSSASTLSPSLSKESARARDKERMAEGIYLSTKGKQNVGPARAVGKPRDGHRHKLKKTTNKIHSIHKSFARLFRSENKKKIPNTLQFTRTTRAPAF